MKTVVAGGMWRGGCGGLVAGATNDGISHLKQDSSESEKLAWQLKSSHHKAAFKTNFDHLGACTAFMLPQTGIPLIQLGVATCTQDLLQGMDLAPMRPHHLTHRYGGAARTFSSPLSSATVAHKQQSISSFHRRFHTKRSQIT